MMALRAVTSAVAHFTANQSVFSRAFSQLALVNKGLAVGPGGRASVSGITATVFGCSGFLGRYVVQALARTGSQVVLPHRCDDLDVQHLKPMGDLGQVVMYPGFDMRDGDMIAHTIHKSNVVINLIGSRLETWNFGYEEVHVDFPRRLAEACNSHGSIERLMHVSCLGAEEDSPSKRLRTKAQGEAVVRDLFPKATIFKLAPLVGVEDKLSNTWVGIAKRMPFTVLPNYGDSRLQPLYVRDATSGIMRSLHTFDALGKTYHLAGPRVYTTREFAWEVFRVVREGFRPLPLPGNPFLYAAKAVDWIQKRAPPLPMDPSFRLAWAEDSLTDFVVPAGEGVLTLEDLGVRPIVVTSGTPIEHIRHFRAGGYDLGSTMGTDPYESGAPLYSGRQQQNDAAYLSGTGLAGPAKP